MTIRDRIRAWLGIESLSVSLRILDKEAFRRIAALEADVLALSNHRIITPVNQPENRPRPLSGAAIRRFSERINAKTFDEENHG